MAYTAAEQADISERYPGIQWVNGMPYASQATRSGEMASQGPNGEPLDYLGNPITETGESSFAASHTDEGGMPWWMQAFYATPAVGYGLAAIPALVGGSGVAAATGGSGVAAATGGTGTSLGSGLLTAVGGWPGVASLAGKTIGGIANAQTANRTEQDNRNQTQDVLNQRSAEATSRNQGDRVQMQMQQQTAAQQEQRAAYLNALRGALARGAQDVTIDRSQFTGNIPNISFAGSPRPSQLGSTGREAGGVLERQAMERLMNPTKAEELPTYQPPAMSEASQAGFWEKLLGPLSLGLNTASALRPGAPQASPSARAFSPADTQFRA